MGFRLQLVVVSSLSVGIPFTVGFRLQLFVVSSLSVGIPFTVGFRLSVRLWLARSLFLETFLPLIKSRLSRSLSRTFLFHDGISGYHGAFHELFFFMMKFQKTQFGEKLFSYISQRVFT
jgi:hypothetical protein